MDNIKFPLHARMKNFPLFLRVFAKWKFERKAKNFHNFQQLENAFSIKSSRCLILTYILHSYKSHCQN